MAAGSGDSSQQNQYDAWQYSVINICTLCKHYGISDLLNHWHRSHATIEQPKIDPMIKVKKRSNIT